MQFRHNIYMNINYEHMLLVDEYVLETKIEM